jgi:hypothetical protein
MSAFSGSAAGVADGVVVGVVVGDVDGVDRHPSATPPTVVAISVSAERLEIGTISRRGRPR